MKRSRIFILLLFLLGLVGAWTTNAPIYLRLLYLSILSGVASWLWVQFSLTGIRLSRHSRSLRANVGDFYDEYYAVENVNRIPCPWLEIHNETDLPGAAGSRVLVNIGKGEKRTYNARTWLVQRGAFPLGPTTLTSRDPLGLFQKNTQVPASSELIVLPMLVDIESFPAPPGLLPGGKVLRRKSIGVTPHAAGVREYAPGDALRRIHWATSARRQQLMVKEFDQDPQAEVWIFLDAQEEAQATRADDGLAPHWDGWTLGKRPELQLPPSTLEYGVTIAASLVHYFIRARRSIGLVAAGQSNIAIPADYSTRQEEKILETLAFVKAGTNLSIESLVRAQAAQLPSGSSAMLITPSVHPELMITIDELQRRNLHPTVVLLDAESFGGAAGSATLEETLKNANISVCRVTCGADLSTALTNFSTATFTKESYLWRKPSTL
ncbi:MAG: DUF58 domain-containing protein [Anaerolineae bacterium]|jgi:uncharacterized protein (DUF58 family)|nr:DUF58 domain-containing protein [Anaerolineae bacterium]MBT7070726.1 DUF58 domain-containing protein [Anaerolineae bacterium]MBT7324712.1 DUF58 domain-containing protein [Anaerolineae bacterium]